jgi:hypothetical protein
MARRWALSGLLGAVIRGGVVFIQEFEFVLAKTSGKEKTWSGWRWIPPRTALRKCMAPSHGAIENTMREQ